MSRNLVSYYSDSEICRKVTSELAISGTGLSPVALATFFGRFLQWAAISYLFGIILFFVLSIILDRRCHGLDHRGALLRDDSGKGDHTLIRSGDAKNGQS
jgi:hypothetical protein